MVKLSLKQESPRQQDVQGLRNMILKCKMYLPEKLLLWKVNLTNLGLLEINVMPSTMSRLHLNLTEQRVHNFRKVFNQQ